MIKHSDDDHEPPGPCPFPPPPRFPGHRNCTLPMIPSSPSATNFSISSIAIAGVIFSCILLLGYYLLVIKCCFRWNRFEVRTRFSNSRARRQEDPLIVYSPAAAAANRGLDEALISSIPIIQFKKNEDTSFFECAVCLSEFQEEEKLRVLPNCNHPFHIHCIDAWLQNNANCPLCRSYISITTQIISPTSSSENSTPFISADEDFVAIDFGEEEQSQETGDSGELSVQLIEQRPTPKKARKLHHISSMGDEWINVRGKDDLFSVQPIRRSVSMDSSGDRQLYLSVQEFIQQSRDLNEVSNGEGCSSSSSSTSSRGRRSFFSFGQSRGSRGAVLPIQMEL